MRGLVPRIHAEEDVDGRDKPPGHNEGEVVQSERDAL
jgi:hypothetical protein